MAGTHKMMLLIGLMLTTSITQAHDDLVNTDACHAISQPYHYHNNDGDPASYSKRKTRSKASGEDSHNATFCASVGGRTEMRYAYTYPGSSSYVKADYEIETMVYEGGLDKRSKVRAAFSRLCFFIPNRQKARGDDLRYQWEDGSI